MDETSCVPSEALKEQTKTYPAEEKFENYLSLVQVGVQVFFEL